MLIKNTIIQTITFIAIPLALVVFIINFFFSKNKIKKEKNKLNKIIENVDKEILEEKNNEENLLNNLEAQLLILEKNNEIQKNNIKENIENNNIKYENQKLEIKNKNIFYDLNNYFENKNLINEINLLENKLNENKLKLHTLEIDKENIIPKLEKLSFIEERIVELNEQEKELLKENESIELVKEVLEIAYKKMKENVSPKFTKNLSNNIEKISNGKYKNVRINDEEGIIVEKENGEYVSAEKLSIGTIDQLYLSLRFGAIKEISEEKMPIILDEAFAYYDGERLKNIVKTLNEEFKENQIIIFTCTDREKEILEKENIKYNLINL